MVCIFPPAYTLRNSHVFYAEYMFLLILLLPCFSTFSHQQFAIREFFDKTKAECLRMPIYQNKQWKFSIIDIITAEYKNVITTNYYSDRH